MPMTELRASEGREKPALLRSELQPEVTLDTAFEIVSLLQAACEHRPDSQLLMGSTTDVLLPPIASDARAPAFRQSYSDDAAISASVCWHPDDSLRESQSQTRYEVCKLRTIAPKRDQLRGQQQRQKCALLSYCGDE